MALYCVCSSQLFNPEIYKYLCIVWKKRNLDIIDTKMQEIIWNSISLFWLHALCYYSRSL